MSKTTLTSYLGNHKTLLIRPHKRDNSSSLNFMLQSLLAKIQALSNFIWRIYGKLPLQFRLIFFKSIQNLETKLFMLLIYTDLFRARVKTMFHLIILRSSEKSFELFFADALSN